MRKSKILGIALAAAMVSSVAATAAFSVNAKVSASGIDGETVGITGSFNGWKEDVAMTNENGVWTGTIDVDVTEDMLGDAMTDDGKGNPIPRTDITGKALLFKVRTNGDWTNSWGDYEAAYNRTWNSQTNCAVVCEAGQHITINVALDTTKIVDQSRVEDPEDVIEVGSGDEWNVWPITYTYEVSGGASTEKPAEETPAEEAPAEEKPAEEAPTTGTTPEEAPAEEAPAEEKPAEQSDTTPVQTGDAASAAALVAVVLASLGTAVVMTKKASAKD